MPRPNRDVSKAKDFKGAIKRLLQELSGFKKLIIISLVLAALGAILTIVTPNILSDLTDEISKGLTINTTNMEKLQDDLLTNLNEETFAGILNLNIDESTIYKVNTASISALDKEKFNNTISAMTKENATTSLGKLPDSVLDIILEDSTYNDILITKEDKINLLKSLSNYNSETKDYSFITNDIKNKDIYYSLEGYLYPDTYEFYENSSFETIVRTMLNNTKKKLSTLDLKKSKYSIHELLTIASIIEQEAVNKEDREKVSQVIYTRLDKKMALGMDVTAYYGSHLSLKETITTKELNAVNPYNTRNLSFIGLPVGPICNPSLESINAALNPSDTNFEYFYADINTGKVYFAEDIKGFYEIQKKLGEN